MTFLPKVFGWLKIIFYEKSKHVNESMTLQVFGHPNTMDNCNASHVGPMQLEKHMVEVESSLFCLDPGRQMMSMLRRWEIGATLILVRIHCISLSGEGRGLRAVSLGICDYCI